MITHFDTDLCTLHLALLCLEGSFVKGRCRGILRRLCGLLRSCRVGICSSIRTGNSSLRMSLEVDRAIDNLLALENDQHKLTDQETRGLVHSLSEGFSTSLDLVEG